MPAEGGHIKMVSEQPLRKEKIMSFARAPKIAGGIQGLARKVNQFCRQKCREFNT
jgi:hypothetical protein